MKKKSFQQEQEEKLLKQGREWLKALEVTNSYYYSGKDNKTKMKNIAWSIFSAYVRKRDFAKNKGKCYTCPKVLPSWQDMQACHYISRSRNATLYNEINVKGGCPACNSPRIGQGRPRTFSYNLNLEHGEGTSDELYRLSQQSIKEDIYFHYQNAEIYYQKLLALKEPNML